MPKSKPFQLTSAYIEFLHDRGIAVFFPGVEPVKAYECLDLNLLESAAKQPFQAGWDVEFYPTIFDKAACLFFSIAGGHIFANGNKRTAVLALDLFLTANAIYLVLSNEEIKKLAEDTASFNERGENPKDVRERIRLLVEKNSFSASKIRLENPKLYRQIHRWKNTVRNAYINKPGTLPLQAQQRGMTWISS